MSAYTNARNPNFTPRKKTALEHRKLNLFAPTPGNYAGKQATLIWGVFAGNPRLTVYTGDPEDETEKNGNGRISANLDTPTFYAFIEILGRVADSPVDIVRKIKNKNFAWENGKRAEEPTNVSELVVGRDSENGIWIGVFAENRPEIKFYLGPSEWHHLCDENNVPISKDEASELYALGYCNLLSNMVSEVLVKEYVDETANYSARPIVTSSKPPPSVVPNNIETSDIPF